MATDLISALANIVANARQANQPIAIHSPAQFTPFTAGHSKSTGTTNLSELSSSNYTANQGWGPVGEAFGKGMGDYLNETVLKAAKNKYAMENDPMEIEKRATQLFNVYQQAGPEEQKKIEWMLNNTPEGLKWRDKIKKNAGYLLTQYPDEMEESGAPHPKAGQMAFVKVQPNEQMQKAQALSAMSPEQRNKMMFAQEGHQQAAAEAAQAGAAQSRAQTAEMPTRLQMDKEKIAQDAQRVKLEEDRVNLEAQRVELARQQNPAIIAAHWADVKYKNKLAAQGDPLARQIALESLRNQDTLLKTSFAKYLDLTSKITTSRDMDPKAQEEALLSAAVNSASEMKTISPTDPTAIGLYGNAARGLIKHYEDYRVKFQKDRKTVIDPNIANQARNLIVSWGSNIGSEAELEQYLATRSTLANIYWRQFYPDLGPNEGSVAWTRTKESGDAIRAQVLPQLKKRQLVVEKGLPAY